MIAFKVTINDGQPVIAGIGDHGVVSAIVTHSTAEQPDRPAETVLDVGGLSDAGKREFVQWIETCLKAGDRVLIEVVEVSGADTPAHRHRDDPEIVLRAKRESLKRLKEELG